MLKDIPDGLERIQEGLYRRSKTVTMRQHTKEIWELHSAEGYCFYDLATPENYNEEGELLPAEERVYAKYMIMPADTEYLKGIISVPAQEGYEIVS